MTHSSAPVRDTTGTPRTPLIRRLLAVGLTLALLVLAAQVNKLPGKVSTNHDITRLAVGQTGDLGTAQITVTDVKLAGQVLKGEYTDTPSRTRGMYVVVTVRVRQPGPKKIRTDLHAIGGGRTFNSSNRPAADPSFESETSALFEVPRENLPGLKVTLVESSLILAFDKQLEVDLGLDAARIALLRTDEVPRVPDTARLRGL